MLAMTLTTGDLAGTAVGEREEESRATEAAAAVGAAEGKHRAGDTWRSIGDIASAIMDRVKQAPQPASEGGVSARLRRCTHRR